MTLLVCEYCQRLIHTPPWTEAERELDWPRFVTCPGCGNVVSESYEHSRDLAETYERVVQWLDRAGCAALLRELFPELCDPPSDGEE